MKHRRSIIVPGAVALLAAAAPAHAGVTEFTDPSAFASAVGGPVAVDTFESDATGTLVTALPTLDISSVSGVGGKGQAVGQYIGSSTNFLPFQIFNKPLPSGTQYLSNDLNEGAWGAITFTFSSPMTAVGAYIADSVPLGDFEIEAFDGTTPLGTVDLSPRTLPSSFAGLVSDRPFTSVTFFAASDVDSWGLDNLQDGVRVAVVPEPDDLALLLAGLALAGTMARRRQR